MISFSTMMALGDGFEDYVKGGCMHHGVIVMTKAAPVRDWGWGESFQVLSGKELDLPDAEALALARSRIEAERERDATLAIELDAVLAAGAFLASLQPSLPLA